MVSSVEGNVDRGRRRNGWQMVSTLFPDPRQPVLTVGSIFLFLVYIKWLVALHWKHISTFGRNYSQANLSDKFPRREQPWIGPLECKCRIYKQHFSRMGRWWFHSWQFFFWTNSQGSKDIYSLFTCKKFYKIEIVVLSFVFDKYCPIMD